MREVTPMKSNSSTILVPMFSLILGSCAGTDGLDESENETIQTIEHNVLYDNKLEDTNPDPNIVEVTLTAGWSEIEISEGTTLNMMTYNGSFPGPLLEANVGDRVIVHFKNNLGEPTTVHWHGLRIPDRMDGTPRVQSPVLDGETFRYEFRVPDSGTYWYHPHVRSYEQVERGLYGPIIIRDPAEPQVDAERIIIVDDLLLDENNSDFAYFDAARYGMHGRSGNLLLGNGRADSGSMERDPVYVGTIERWRIVNTSNARTFVMTVDGVADAKLIGTDGGPLPARPLEWLLLPIGQRYDVLVTHGIYESAQLTAHIPVVNENNEVEEAPFPIYRLDVSRETNGTPRRVVWPQADLSEYANRPIDQEVRMTLSGYGTDTGIMWTINGQSHPTEPLYTFAKGQTVVMTIANEAGPEHPFHLHGQFFEIIGDGRAITEQPGLKDTVLIPGQTELKIRAYFDNPGQWMAHCHILEHAALGMMGEIIVTE